MVRKLLAFSRRNPLTLEMLRLDQVVADTVKTLQRILPESIAVAFEAPHPVPLVETDRGSIEQILLNLATNARDAMPHGGGLTLRVAVDTPEQDERCAATELVVIEVTDTGTGMGPETLRHIFEPFYTTKGSGKGTGLGMAMVYGLVKQQGGEVRVLSTLGTGTTVRLLFPVRAAQPEASPPAAECSVPRGRESILLVEDEASLRRVARLSLEHLGYRVAEARDGREALQVLQGNPDGFDLILSDIVMPNLGGVQLSEELHRLSVVTPILLATGYVDSEQLSQLARAGVPLLRKPWTLDQLARCVRETLDLDSRCAA